MPEQKQSFSFQGYDSNTLLNIAYGTLLDLGWTPKYAGENILIAYTPRSWKKYDDEISIETTNNNLTVTSKLVHGEAFDMLGKNKKHINEFISAFEKIKSAQGRNLAGWQEAIEQLKQNTIVAANEEIKQAQEIDKTMKLSGANLYASYSIIAINLVVFVLMALDGAGIMEANGTVHIKWGSNYTPLTLSGDWWRLITNVFIHFGLIHVAMNTYAFYMAGVYLEPMLGKTRYITAYLCTGVIASLVSLWWHKEGVNSAGASGAIFGMYGVFLALLLTNLIPKKMRGSLLSSIGIFVVYNLFYGMKSGVDNAAHIGGLLSGAIIGLIFYPGLKKEEQGNKNRVVLLAIATVTIAVTWIYLKNTSNAGFDNQRKEIENYLKETQYKDGEEFVEKIGEFATMEEKALAPFNDTTLNNKELAERLTAVSGEWDKAKTLLNEVKNYDISNVAKTKLEILIDYTNARKEEIGVIEKIAAEEKQQDYDELAVIRNRISDMLNRLKGLN